jgi:hypothetical protein
MRQLLECSDILVAGSLLLCVVDKSLQEVFLEDVPSRGTGWEQFFPAEFYRAARRHARSYLQRLVL